MSRKALVPLNILPLSAAPTTPTLQSGDLYWDTTASAVSAYTGSAWSPVAHLSNANIFTNQQQINAQASGVGLIVRANATTPGNIQQWQDSSGNVALFVGSNGSFRAGASIVGTGWAINNQIYGASVIGFVIRGATSQTANLQEWQNSAGTVAASIDANGSGRFAYLGVGSGVSLTAMSNVLITSASVVGLIIKGAASQTANLQEWQNSAGTVLSRVRPTGGAVFNGLTVFGTDYASGNASALFESAATTNIPIAVRGMASQTGDLQQWQNSAGTVLSKIDKDGYLTLPGSPTATLHAATKQYVDDVAAGINFHAAVKYATTGALGTTGNLVGGTITTTYNNGTSGVGATITVATSSNWSSITIDGQSLVAGDRILIKDQTSALQNGIYTVTTVGAVGNTTSFVFTRATDADNSPSGGELAPGDFTFVQFGTTNGGFGFINNSASAITIGTTAVSYTIFNTGQSVIAGDGLTETTPGTLAVNSTVVRNTTDQVISGTLTANSFIPSSSTVPVNGVYLPAANTLGFATNSGVRLQINSSGEVGIGATPSAGNTLRIAKSITGSTFGTGIFMDGIVASDVTNRADYLLIRPNTTASSFTVNSLTGVRVDGFGVIGAGSTINNAYGFFVDTGYTFGASNFAFYSAIPSGSNRWNFYAQGTAANYFAGQTTVGSTSLTLGSGSVAQQFGVVAGAATTVGTVIRGAASQTADLVQLQNSAGSRLVKVTSDGKLIFGSGISTSSTSIYFDQVTTTAGVPEGITWNLVTTNTSSASVLAVRTGGSYATDLYFSTANSGDQTATERMRINSSGTVSINGFLPAATGLIVKGAASQTADLQQLQTSSSTVLGGANALAQTYTGSTAPITVATGGATTAASGTGTVATITTTSAHGLATGDLVTVAGVTPTGYNGTYLVTGTPSSTQFTYANTTTGAQTVAGTVSAPAQASITARSAGTVGMVIRTAAVTGSGARPLLVQNTNGTLIAYIDNFGAFYGAGFGPVNQNGGFATTSSASPFQISTASASIVPLVVKGAASQTANLQEWQDSTGTNVGSLSPVGALRIGSRLSVGNTGIDYGLMSALIGSATTIGFVLRGASGQTGDLQQWQNNSGTVLANISGSGYLFTPGVGDVAQTGAYFQTNPTGTNNGAFLFNTRAAGNKALIVQGSSSQTANLQEWQNSAGTVKAYIDSSAGSFFYTNNLNGPYAYFDYIMGGNGYNYVAGATAHFTAKDASTKGLVIKGFASQTARLQEWQDSTGAVRSSISADGTSFTTTQVNTEYVTDAGSATPYFRLTSNTIQVLNRNVGYVNLTVKGFASQTADLTQWQNSSGTVLAKVDANGNITAASISSSGTATTVNVNTAVTLDTVALANFTTLEYVVSIKQGTKIRSSKVLVQTDGTTVDSTEFSILETGGLMSGVSVTASVSSTNCILTVTITDAATTNATVKILKSIL